MATAQLHEHLASCSVRIIADQRRGSGFFVAPGRVLTCAHVISGGRGAASSIHVAWGTRMLNIEKVVCIPERYDNGSPLPDIALLDLKPECLALSHPCVY